MPTLPLLQALGLSEFRGLQLFELLDQQGQVLEQVPVLEQQLVDPGLGLHTGCRLRSHLILQELYLMGERGGVRDGACWRRELDSMYHWGVCVLRRYRQSIVQRHKPFFESGSSVCLYVRVSSSG